MIRDIGILEYFSHTIKNAIPCISFCISQCSKNVKSFKKLNVSEAFLRLHCSALSGKTQRKKIIWWDNALLPSKAKINISLIFWGGTVKLKDKVKTNFYHVLAHCGIQSIAHCAFTYKNSSNVQTKNEDAYAISIMHFEICIIYIQQSDCDVMC